MSLHNVRIIKLHCTRREVLSKSSLRWRLRFKLYDETVSLERMSLRTLPRSLSKVHHKHY